MDREAIREVLAQAGLGELRGLQRIESGLGTRRFYRVRLAESGKRLIARVEAPEDPAGRPAGIPPEPPLEPLRALLEREGLPVPRRLGRFVPGGIALLEDLGDRSLTRVLPEAAPARRRHLLCAAVDLVPRLQRIADPGGLPAFQRCLGPAHFAYKAELFQRYSLPLALGRAPRRSEGEVVREAFLWIAEQCAAAPQRLAHRDLQSQNLHLVQREEGETLVLIDLQGALLAPPEYDLACLLGDSYVEISEEEARAQRSRIRPRLPDAPAADLFEKRFTWLTVTRKSKDHARFLYAARERGDERCLRSLPRTAALLRRTARSCSGDAPALARLAELVHGLPEDDPCAR